MSGSLARRIPWLCLLGLLLAAGGCGTGDTARAGAAVPGAPEPPAGGPTGSEEAILAGGCFWCVEAPFDGLPGVLEAVSGYTGGTEPDPTYEAVSAGATSHYEAVRVRFDPARISYAEILDVFWRQIDPVDGGGQFADRGSQYRTAIFVAGGEQRRMAEASKRFLEESGWLERPIATAILPAGPFYPAESYHQDYHRTHSAEYESYKRGSGRGPFLERFWKDKPQIRPATRTSPDATEEDSRVDTHSTDEELRDRLTPLQYHVTREAGTEPPFRNEFWDHHEPGIYVDVVSGEPLFASTDKFDSGTGWPSFTRPLDPNHLVEKIDATLGMSRTEVRSREGKSHLGHLFPDGPPPTGMRYCINSAALRFIPVSRLEAEGYGKYAGMFEKKSSR